MRLVICHKENGLSVNLFYKDAATARAARTNAKREASEKRSRVIHFGPDLMGEDCEIHQDCLGSASVVMGDPEDFGYAQIDGKWINARAIAQQEAAKPKEKPLIVPVQGVLATPPGDGKGA